MGYYMDLEATRFRIKAEHVPAVMDAIMEWAASKKWLSWIAVAEVRRHYEEKDILHMFRACRWSVDKDENGDLIDLDFCGEKLGDDEQFFEAIAKWVETKSYIQIRGEEGACWRWFFIDGMFHTDNIKTSWDSDDILGLRRG